MPRGIRSGVFCDAPPHGLQASKPGKPHFQGHATFAKQAQSELIATVQYDMENLSLHSAAVQDRLFHLPAPLKFSRPRFLFSV